MAEVTALGCAFAAGLAVGVWKDIEALVALQEKHFAYETFVPKVWLYLHMMVLCTCMIYLSAYMHVCMHVCECCSRCSQSQ